MPINPRFKSNAQKTGLLTILQHTTSITCHNFGERTEICISLFKKYCRDGKNIFIWKRNFLGVLLKSWVYWTGIRTKIYINIYIIQIKAVNTYYLKISTIENKCMDIYTQLWKSFNATISSTHDQHVTHIKTSNQLNMPWVSYQIRKTGGCACTGNAHGRNTQMHHWTRSPFHEVTFCGLFSTMPLPKAIVFLSLLKKKLGWAMDADISSRTHAFECVMYITSPIWSDFNILNTLDALNTQRRHGDFSGHQNITGCDSS